MKLISYLFQHIFLSFVSILLHKSYYTFPSLPRAICTERDMLPHYSFARLRVGNLYNKTRCRWLKDTYFLFCSKVFFGTIWRNKWYEASWLFFCFFFGVMHVRYWFCFFCIFFFALWIIITSNWNMIVRVHVVQTYTVVDSNFRFSVCWRRPKTEVYVPYYLFHSSIMINAVL